MAFGVDDAAAIATAASAVASGVTAATQGVRNKKSYKYTKKLQDAQNAYNTEQAQVAYARQREFYDYMYDKNSPLSQMQQLKKAGLNPNLAYGQLGDGTSAPSVPQASAAGAGQFQIDNSGFAALPSSLSQFASMLQSFKMTNAQVDNLNANTEKVGHETKNIDANTKLTENQAKKVDIETENLIENLFEILPKQAEKLKTEILKLKSDMDNSQQITQGQVQLFKQQISNLISQTKLNKANMRQLGQVISRYNDIIDSQTGLSNSQAESVAQDAEFKSMIQEYRRQLFDKLKKTPASNDFFGKGSVVGELMILYLLKNLE